MKPRMNLNRHVAQRHDWMRTMLVAMAGFHGSPCIFREKGSTSLEVRVTVDIGKSLTSNGAEGVMSVFVPDECTDDEAEAMLLRFIDSLPEPKEPT